MYDVDEQQRIDEIKAWLKRYGNWLLWGLLALLLAATGAMGYRHYKTTEAEKASSLYDALLKIQDPKKIRTSALNIMDTYPKTAYAPRAALISAKAGHDAGNLNDARSDLQWVIDHSNEEGLKDIARLRLARILFDEKKYSDALSLLDAKHGDAYDGLYSDLKGDVLAAQGNKSAARSAYLIALNKVEKTSSYKNLIQLKLDAMGDGK